MLIPRLKRRAEFLQIAGKGRKWVTPGLILQACRHPLSPDHPAPLRVGFTASRKVGIAVARNRARRRLRAVCDQMLPDHAVPGQDYVVIARKNTLARTFAALVADLETALRRLDSWQG